MNITIEQIVLLGVMLINLVALFKDIQKTRSGIKKDSEDIEHTTHQDLMELYKLMRQQRDDLSRENSDLKSQLSQRDAKIAQLILGGKG